MEMIKYQPFLSLIYLTVEYLNKKEINKNFHIPAGVPIRPNGIELLNFSLILSGTVVNIGVSMNPGRIALQRILYLLMQMLLIEKYH
jgi:hypothetical protein